MPLPDIKWEVMVDWDATDWAAEPDFTQDYDEISGDVADDGINFIGYHRGKEREAGNAPAATLEITMTPALCDKYSPFTTGDLAGKIRPWLPVRVRAQHNAIWYNIFFRFCYKAIYISIFLVKCHWSNCNRIFPSKYSSIFFVKIEFYR